MIKLRIGVLLVALLVPAGASSQRTQNRADLSGVIDTKLAGRIQGPFSASERRVTLDLDLELQRGLWRLAATGRARYEDRLEPKTLRDVDLRELYLSRRWRNATATVGRQQVVWGKSDGLRVLDIVNPLDLREFILEDFESSRIPLWLANLEAFFGESSLQVLVIPDVESNRVPDPGGEFGTPPVDVADISTPVRPVRRPGDGMSRWEYGVRVETHLGLWSLTANGLYGWSDDPVPLRRLTATGIEIRPEIVRKRVIGVSGDRVLGSTVLRFEGTLTPDGYREVTDPTVPDGFHRGNEVRGAVGLDWFLGETLVSPQLFLELMPAADAPVETPRDREFATLLVRRELMQARLELKCFTLWGLREHQWWVAPEASYELGGRFVMSLGADLFGGPPTASFGRFFDRDRVFTRLQLHF